MTVSTTTSQIIYTGDGVDTTFPFPFKVLEQDDLVVQIIEIDSGDTTTLLADDYDVTGIGDENGGTVTYDGGGTPLAATHQIRIARELDLTQDVSFPRFGGFSSESIEEMGDRIVMMLQQLSTQIGENNLGAQHYVLRNISGTNDIVASTGRSISSLVEYDIFYIQPPNTNTNEVDIEIDGLPSVDVLDAQGDELAAGEFNSARMYLVMARNSPVTELRIISER